MRVTKFNEDWKFWLEEKSFALVWDIPEKAKNITLPHDAMLESVPHADSPNGNNTGYRDGGVYCYVKHYTPAEADREKTILLKFEGVYMNAMVYVNGQLAAKCPYGYTGFYAALNDYLKYGEQNEIRVIVRNSSMPNSRWYSGGGIYRDVCLLTAGKVYIKPESVQVATEVLDESSATLSIHAEIKNRDYRYHDLTVTTEIIDARNQVAVFEKSSVVLFEGEECSLPVRVVVDEARPWSEDTPYLYRVVTRIYDRERLLDEDSTTFGIRTLSADAKNGFRVNGKPVKFRGACIHHDSGILGAATYDDFEYRRVRILKEAGFNAIRMSHQPAAPALLRACDELGMYVMDESFDMWQRCKSDSDYGLFFDEWWEKDIEAMIRNDYNHPSVVMYSIGNEIPEIGTDHGAKICRDICEKVKSLDRTRYTLASINGVFAAGDSIPQIMEDVLKEASANGRMPEGLNVNDFMTAMDLYMDQIVVHDEVSKRLDKACAYTDIAGYNYMSARYEKDREEHPNRIIVGSETNPPEIARNWELVTKYQNVIGDFTWAGWDYIGEAGIGVPAYQFGEGGFGATFPCQLAYCGDIDITGFRRPASYFREIVFGLRKDPYIAVQNPEEYGKKVIKTPWVISDAVSSWTYPGMEGKPVVVEVYSPGDEVELLLNDHSLGRKASGKTAGFITLFELDYWPGTLKAIAYKNGTEIGNTVLMSAEGEGTFQINSETGRNNELAFVEISYTDSKGVLITDRSVKVSVSAENALEARIGSGDPKPVYHYIGEEAETWNGRALLIVRRNKTKEMVKVTVKTGSQETILEI